MKCFYFIFMLLSLSLVQLQAQNERIQNTKLRLEGGNLVISYDITQGPPIGEISLSIKTKAGQIIPAIYLTGDIGTNITPGKGKNILWNMALDKIDLGGQEVNVTVIASSKSFPSTAKIEEISFLNERIKVKEKIVLKTKEKYFGILESQVAQNNQFTLKNAKTDELLKFDRSTIKSISHHNPLEIVNVFYLKDGSKLNGRLKKIDPVSNDFYIKSIRGLQKLSLSEIAKIETLKGRGYWFFAPQVIGRLGYLSNWGGYLNVSSLISYDSYYDTPFDSYYDPITYVFTAGVTKKISEGRHRVYLMLGGGWDPSFETFTPEFGGFVQFGRGVLNVNSTITGIGVSVGYLF